MRTKAVNFYQFIFVGHDVFCSIRILLQILRTLFEFPGWAFHESMHLICIFLFGSDLRVTRFYFYRIKKYPHRTCLRTYALSLSSSYSCSATAAIGSAAPLIGWLVGVICFVAFHQWVLLAYFFLSLKTMFLSEIDIRGIYDRTGWETLHRVLMRIHRLVVAN
jgi:hypothetical protein